MARMSDREAAAICSAHGHNPLGVLTKTPLKHRFECSCGYVTTYRATIRHALEGGVHHMRLEAARIVELEAKMRRVAAVPQPSRLSRSAP